MSGWISAGCLVGCVLLAAELIRTRSQLRASREAFDVLWKQAPVGILRADANGNCTYANETWCELSGLSQEETRGHLWSKSVHPEDLAMVMEKWQESVGKQQSYVNEVRVVRPDGSVRHVLSGACPILDTKGKACGFIGTVLDITKRRDAEREAREKESLLRTLVDHSSAAIYLKDTVGRYLMVNHKFCETWPWGKEFRQGTTPYDWFPEPLARSFVETDAEVWKTGQTYTFEETIPVGSEQRTFLSVKFPVLDEAGGVVAVGGISADITDLQQARHELAQRERLLRSLIEVQETEKQLLCHEFHDGLIQYAVGSKMLLEGLRAGEHFEHGQMVIDSVIECLAKGIEDGRRVIRGIRPAVLDDLGLGAALDDLADELRESGITVATVIDPAIDTIPPELQTTVYRVLQESLNNTRKHSGCGQVEVTVSRVGNQIELVVQDHGSGFDQSKTDSDGFGLMGIRERVRLAGGDCRVETAPGEGTCVSARLPLKAPSTAGPSRFG